MTPAALAAALAGICAALAVADAARALARRRPGPTALKLLVAVGRRVGRPTPSHDLATRLAAAGAAPSLTPQDVVAAQLGGALLATLAAGLVAPAPLVPLAAALALAAPRALLRRRTAARVRAIGREVADVLDLLRVAVGAGLAPDRALAEVGRRHRGVLGRELARTAAQLDLGVGRERALAALVARAPHPAVAALAAALGRTARHGTAPAPELAALAADARAARSRALAEHAARAAPKVQLVVSLVQVPAVLLLVAASLVTTIAP